LYSGSRLTALRLRTLFGLLLYHLGKVSVQETYVACGTREIEGTYQKAQVKKLVSTWTKNIYLLNTSPLLYH